MLKTHLHKKGRKCVNPNCYFQYFKCNLNRQLSQEDDLFSFSFLLSGDCLFVSDYFYSLIQHPTYLGVQQPIKDLHNSCSQMHFKMIIWAKCPISYA